VEVRHPFREVAAEVHPSRVGEAHPRAEPVEAHQRVEAVVEHPIRGAAEVQRPCREAVEVRPFREVEGAVEAHLLRAVVVVVEHLIRVGGAGAHSVRHLTLYLLLPMKHFPATRSLL
jgi:hypothetical protein